MKGDFSRWGIDATDNSRGVLHQQGRVLLDQDWNAATQIEEQWQDQMGQDAIGANVAAVPAAVPDSFKVTAAVATAAGVSVTFNPGRVWVDGVHLHQPGSAPVTLDAIYLAPPLQDPQQTPASIAATVRDAVILEVWGEAFSAFQDPARLIEPALGGPDTTERIRTSMALRLMRLAPGDDCANLDLADDFAAKGQLTVTPAPTIAIAGPCPVQDGGGYSGFEHYLYRIEIADPSGAAQARFKWSQFNGGLVGRGEFTSTGASAGSVAIRANDQMINHCGLTTFYLEALGFDATRGHWRVMLTADATLPSDGTLMLTNITGSWPVAAPASAFFRLWNGVALISAFPTGLATPNELKDGLRLEFAAALPNNSNYTPGDYWTFPVRAAGVPFDPTLWPTNAPPQGIHYHRVPLAVLEWTGAPPVTITAAAGQIHDCRRVFQPLTRLQTCCTYRVGDGLHTFGDFDSIQAAIDALPGSGGEVCVLPGTYIENVLIDGRQNVTVHGCGVRSRVQSAAPSAGAADPVIRIRNSNNIRIEGLQLNADPTGIGIWVEATPRSSEIQFVRLFITASTRSAIHVDDGGFVTLNNSHILMADAPSPWPGVFMTADDVLIERNVIEVQRPAAAGRGGLQLGGTSERVRVVNNLIDAGIGNGITLGTIREITPGGDTDKPWVVDELDPCSPCLPGDTGIPPDDGTGPQYESAGALYEITIERNRIYNMGLNGIGVVGFFDLSGADEFISVIRLTIIGNDIRRCLGRTLAPISSAMLDSMGYGGIALADVEYLVVRDNVIEGNGQNHLDPVCGIFVLHGEGVEIDRNRILNNGAKTAEPPDLANDGRRGGINIVFAVARMTSVQIFRRSLPAQDGVPAAKIHDNIVVQPLGQALALDAFGPVSVVGNQFTSQGMIMKFRPLSPSFVAGCVFIGNLGVSNEFFSQLISFNGVLSGTAPSSPAVGAADDDAEFVPQEGIDDRASGQFLANGNVIFNSNQCMLDLIERGLTLSLSSILIYSMDDVSFHGNECDCNLLDDFVITQAFVFGFSLRVGDNRFKEGWVNAFFSAVTLGVMNATTNNQSTHCLFIGGAASLKVDRGNRVLREAVDKDYTCGRKRDKIVVASGRKLGVFDAARP